MTKDNMKLAVVISSVNFGLGDLINLINGISTDIVETQCKVIGEVAISFLFVIVYYRGGSTLPCIVAHSGNDITSTFANDSVITFEMRILMCAIRFSIAIIYSLYIALNTTGKAKRQTSRNNGKCVRRSDRFIASSLAVSLYCIFIHYLLWRSQIHKMKNIFPFLNQINKIAYCY